jgi:large subunit ribosomal protein L22
MKKSAVYAKHMKARISSKKVKPVMDLIRGKNLHDAKVTLSFDRSKAAGLVLKVLRSAEANAKNNSKMDVKNMYVSETFSGNGPVSKWGKYKGRGRFSRILKRTSHIYVGLSETPNIKKSIVKKVGTKKAATNKKTDKKDTKVKETKGGKE